MQVTNPQARSAKYAARHDMILHMGTTSDGGRRATHAPLVRLIASSLLLSAPRTSITVVALCARVMRCRTSSLSSIPIGMHGPSDSSASRTCLCVVIPMAMSSSRA